MRQASPFTTSITPALLLLFLAPGCTSGRMWWPEHSDVLRTALVKYDVDHGVMRARLVLSNGIFSCDLPDTDRPAAEVQESLQDLVTGACREGAAHLIVDLYRRTGDSWTGRYRGDSHARADTLDPDRDRATNATWYAIDESFLVEFGPLDRAYAIESDQLLADIGDGGRVEIRRDAEQLSGTAWFPEAEVSADFRAEVCEAESDLFDLLQSSVVSLCP